ncbi:pyridoxal-dependent decarboxylase [Burkholderia sp. BCC1988]|uniref:pyridoxal-dependent decarboxylase n=1 Tax=Burkholderia sp. BCC1988 TaxID=2817443 RepID=UPI002AB2EE5B|nr:pyridoxal-dependent decarboxylase [Burkholderia sp. BCC1988]
MNLPNHNFQDSGVESSCALRIERFEREAVEFFASLLRAPSDDCWGGVTGGNGQGNLYGLYLARETVGHGIVYVTSEIRDSVMRALRLLNLRSIVVRTRPSGEMDYEDLERHARRNKGVSAIVVANVGTAWTEARDDVASIRETLQIAGVRNVFVHCDAALSGPYARFIDPSPRFDFAHGADSITFSGHRFLGSPVPCGVSLTRKRHVVEHSERHFASRTALLGPASAYAVLVLWSVSRSLGWCGIRDRFHQCEALASDTVELLNASGSQAWRNPGALTVVFQRPDDALLAKWRLSARGDQAHLVVTPGTGRSQIERFIRELSPISGRTRYAPIVESACLE